MATMKDVAKLAGVSVGTVSNYLNQTRPVSKAVAERIKAAVEELRFSPNLSARSLKSNVYTEIALVLPNRSDPCCVQICQGVEAALQGSGYLLHVAFSYGIPELERQILQDVLKKRVCGLILMSCQPDQGEILTRLLGSTPVVLVDREIPGLEADCICFDNEAALDRMTRSLLEAGYEDLCLFSGSQAFSSEAACARGFRRGMAGREGMLVQTELTREDGFRKITNLLQTHRPDAVITTSESTAVGVTEGLQLLGYDAGALPVFTLGEEHWNRGTHSFAAWSTARPAIAMGRTAAERLLGRLEGDATPAIKTLLQEKPLPLRLRPKASAGVPERAPTDTLRVLMLDTAAVRAFAGLLRSFEHQTGIAVELTMLPHNRLLTAIETGSERYDVVLFDLPWLPKLASGGVLKDLTSVLAQVDGETFFPGCLEHYSAFRGRYYGIPFLYGPQIFYYRKDLFQSPVLRAQYERRYGASLRPPITFDEFSTMAEFFTCHTDAIAYGAGLAAAYEECFAPEIYLRLRAYGGQVFDERGEICIDNAAGRRAYENLRQVLPGMKPDWRQATDTSILADFLRGESAMVISYPPFLTDVADLRKASMIGEIGCALCPGRAPLLGGWSLGVSSGTDRWDAACRFLLWCCDEVTASYFALLGGQSAVAGTYTNDELVSLYPWLPLYHSAYAYASPMKMTARGRTVSADRVDTAVCRHAWTLLEGACTPEEALNRTRKELETLR